MRIDIFTIFPDMVEHFAAQSLLGRARAAGTLDVRVHDLRSAATDPHRSVDDAPFGGGAGMVLMPEPLFGAVEAVAPPRPLLYLGPAGRRFDQAVAASWPPSRGSACCAGATRGWTSGSGSICATASCRSATSCCRAVRWPPWWSSRRSPAWSPG